MSTRAGIALACAAALLGAGAGPCRGQTGRDTAAAEGKFLVGHYPNWSRHSGYDAGKVPYHRLTHILYSSFVSESDGAVFNSDPSDEENLRDLIRRAHAAGVSVSLSFDGSPGTPGFKAMMARPRSRSAFILNCIKTADLYQADGLDFSWRFPSPMEGNDKVYLMRELRASLDAHSRRLLLTCQVPGAEFRAERLPDEIYSLFDYLLVLAFDRGAEREKRVVPMEGLGAAKASLAFYEKRGVPARRLILESPFFGRAYDGGTGIGSSHFGKGSGNDGFWTWKELRIRCEALGYKTAWDEASQSEIALGNREAIVFNGPPSQRKQGEFIRGSGYAGLAVWDLPSDADDARYSLLEALYQGLRKPSATAAVAPPAAPGDSQGARP